MGCSGAARPTGEGGATYEFQWDPFGLRTGKKAGGVWTYYLLDGESVVKEITGSTSTYTTHSPLLDQPLGRGGRYFTPNHLGSTTTLTDGSGNVVHSYQYGPFGETSQSTGEANPFQYAGRERNETGLYYNRARYYRPEWGRFISPDPIGFAGGLNHYVYTENNPLSRLDPLGLDWLLDTSNLAAGWGDALSFGITDRIRHWLGVDRIVDKGSGFYIAGEIIGTVHQSALGGIKPTVSKPPCFPAGTLVLTPAGERPIEEVRVGELVLSADPQTGKQSYQRVVGRFIGEAERLLEIETEDGRRVEATEEHPFWVVGQGFVEARGLGLGDLLVDERGRFRAIVGIKQRTGRLLVYNLEVEGTHTYYANGWWVHNRCLRIPWITPGSLPAEEATRVTEALAHLDAGTRPAEARGWGRIFHNRDGDLPTGVTYREYDVAPAPGTPNRGPRRIVVGSDGAVYYTWTHYGDAGGPPFVRLR